MKYLLLLLFLGALWLAWKKRQAKPVETRPTERPVQAMRQCAHCGVLYPEEDGVCREGQYFCSTAHAESFRAR